MKNDKIQVQELTKIQVQPPLKQATQKSSLQAERYKAERPKKPVMRFNPKAWAKLLYFRDKSDNEVGGFAITEPDDLLFVTDFMTVKQEVTGVSVKFDDNAVADFFDTQVDLGRKPEQFARIWLHTHPGDFAEPSLTDEETFARVFGSCQWALMFVIAQNNKTFARLRFNVGPGGQVLIPVEIDYSRDFGPTNQELWNAEYQANITSETWLSNIGNSITTKDIDEKAPLRNDISSLALPYDVLEEFKKMEPAERQFVLDELADSPDLWDEDEEVMYL